MENNQNEYFIKCFYDQQMKEARLLALRESMDEVKIEFKLDELEFTKKSDNYFSTLLEVRKELEPRGIKLLCKGCSRNAYPSRMSMEMGGGLLANVMYMGKESESKVNIFNDCTLEEYATIEEQSLYLDEWYENIVKVREQQEME